MRRYHVFMQSTAQRLMNCLVGTGTLRKAQGHAYPGLLRGKGFSASPTKGFPEERLSRAARKWTLLGRRERCVYAQMKEVWERWRRCLSDLLKGSCTIHLSYWNQLGIFWTPSAGRSTGTKGWETKPQSEHLILYQNRFVTRVVLYFALLECQGWGCGWRNFPWRSLMSCLSIASTPLILLQISPSKLSPVSSKPCVKKGNA